MSNAAGARGMKIGTRLAGGFGLVLALLLALTVIGVSQVTRINASLATLNAVNSVKQRYAINFRGSVHDRAISLRDVTLVAEPAELKVALADIDRLAGDYAKSAEALDRCSPPAPTSRRRSDRSWRAIKQIEAKTMPPVRKVIEQ